MSQEPVVSQATFNFLKNYRVDQHKKLMADFNSKLTSYQDSSFLEETLKVILAHPSYSQHLKQTDQPNWRGLFGLASKIKEEMPYDFIVAQKYMNIFDRAQSRNFAFDLTLTDIKRFYRLKRCHYSNVVLTDHDSTLSTHRTIDRVNNTGGYTKDNTVVCSLHMNQLKSRLFEDTKSICYVDLNLLTTMCKVLTSKGYVQNAGKVAKDSSKI
jgi:hypothetical protein